MFCLIADFVLFEIVIEMHLSFWLNYQIFLIYWIARVQMKSTFLSVESSEILGTPKIFKNASQSSVFSYLEVFRNWYQYLIRYQNVNIVKVSYRYGNINIVSYRENFKGANNIVLLRKYQYRIISVPIVRNPKTLPNFLKKIIIFLLISMTSLTIFLGILNL